MGTFTISASGFTNGPNGSKAFTVSDADWANLITYMQSKYGTRNDDGTVSPPTPVQALLAWVQSWVVQTRDEIRSAQLLSAQQQAAQSVNVPPIVFT